MDLDPPIIVSVTIQVCNVYQPVEFSFCLAYHQTHSMCMINYMKVNARYVKRGYLF